jgi:hypothetical protein
MKHRLLAVLAVAVLPLAGGCGSSGSGSSGPGADPATMVPATAPIYLEAVVRPDGDVGNGAKDALKKLLNTDDPGKKLAGLFDSAIAKDKTSWDEVKGWLGKRVGIFFTSVGGAKTVGALVADTTDSGKAKDAIAKLAATSHGSTASAITKQTYKGIELGVDATKDTAYAMVGDFAVVGSVDGVHQVIDTSKGGRPLTDVPDYIAARKAVDADNALGTAYVDPQALIDAISTGSSTTSGPFSNPQLLTIVRQAVAKAGRAAAVSLHADGDAVRLDAAAIGAPTGTGTSTAADSLAALPADAWLAIGFGDIGSTLTKGIAQLSQLSSLGTSGPDFSGILDRFTAKTGVDIQKDFLSWMGDGAVYARGRGLADIGGAVTIKSKDPVKSRKAVLILGNALKSAGASVRSATVEGYDTAVEVRSGSVPISLFVAANDDRFSINPQALTDLLSPSAKLGDSDTYKAATKALGGALKPVFILDTPTIVNLLSSFGLGSNASFAKVKPYLDHLGTLSVGTAHDGDVARFALALGLR